MRAKCTFKERDVTRAVKAVTKAGQKASGVRFEKDGGFTVMISGKPADVTIFEEEGSKEWDKIQ